MRKRALFRHVMLATSALVPLGLAAAAFANPLGPNVVGGSATVSGVGTSNVTIHQATPRAIINWNTFNIGAGETTRFIQPSASSVALNRVTGNLGPSVIQGALTANGMVYLVNPNGVMISKTGVINTAGFLASTHDITNENFMAGRMLFNIPGRPNASIVNEGVINSHNYGFAALVAPGVRNSGTITASYGKVALASSGEGFSLDFYGDRLITLAVNDSVASSVIDVATGKPLNSLVKNTGKLSANGGRVELTAAQARTVVDSVINNTGVIEARTVGTRNGKIVLGGPTASTKMAGLPSQTVKVSGKLDVSAKNPKGKGGTIQVTGEKIVVQAASFDASGPAGGGKVLIGGDTGGGYGHWAVDQIPQAALEAKAVPTATSVSIDAATTINASATSVGHGGKVIVWADGDTSFAGTILARGGDFGGNGGFTEVSGKQTLSYTGLADLRAPRGSFGTLLLDPGNMTIQTTGGSNFTGDPVYDTTLDVGLLNTALGMGNVIVQTAQSGTPDGGDIIVDAVITWNAPTTLTLSAYRDIVINGGGSSAQIVGGGGANLVLRADSTGTGTGTISMPAGTNTVRVDWSNNPSGTVAVYYNPSVFGTQDSFTGGPGGYFLLASPSQLTQYMLVNSFAKLAEIGTDTNTLSENYALAKDIGSAAFNGISGTFTGIFDGLDHTISGIPVGQSIFSANAGTIKNLYLDYITATASGNDQFVGTLVGNNLSSGVISNVHVTNSAVNGGLYTGIKAGLIAGANNGLIIDSSSQGTVTLGDGLADTGWNYAGGMVGINQGSIIGSDAFGTVSVGSHAFAGGLVGQNGLGAAVINNSTADVAVTATGLSVSVGGLAGINSQGASIIDSKASGDVTASGSVPPGACPPTCSFVTAGGLVGQNFGTIASSIAPTEWLSLAEASGDVEVGSNGVGGGLVGVNFGQILGAWATGKVTGAAGTATSENDGMTTLGGLVGVNRGYVINGFAFGDVGSSVEDRLEVGGLVGLNSGTITSSFAINNVMARHYSQAGGLVATHDSDCTSCAPPSDGSAYYNSTTISDSYAYTNVTVGNYSLAGGFVGGGSDINGGYAYGTVTGGSNSILGGFAGAHDIGGTIHNSFAYVSVTASGSNTWVGGFVGYNGGTISSSYAFGSTDPSYGILNVGSGNIVGGFAGVNVGLINQMSTVYGVTLNAQNNNVIGGFVGANFGSVNDVVIDGSVANFNSNNIAGALIGANAAFTNFAPGQIMGSSFPTGTYSNYSITYSTYNATGSGNTTGDPVGVQYPTQLPPYPGILSSCTEALCQIFNLGTLGGSTPPSGDPNHSPEIPNQVKAPATVPPASTPPTPPDNLIQLANLTTTPPVDNSTRTPAAPQTPQNTPGMQPRPLTPVLPQRSVCGMGGNCTSYATLLPPGQYIPNQVVVQIPQNVSETDVQQVLAQMGLTVLGSQPLSNGNNALNLQLPPGVTMRDVILRLEQNQIVAAAHANMKFVTAQHVPAAIAPFTESRGDPAQYTMGKLRLGEAHQVASGNNVTVAVIDSEVDTEHAELKGTRMERFDATGAEARAHSHGTAMVGAILARNRLLGIAPGARVLAIRAFSESQTTAESTTFTILKGIEQAVAQGARVINMSFAGPYDPSLEKALKDAADKGVVLVGASGNAGPKSPPLWPGADPNVIAVTATDANDRLFKGANRGPYISIAAPGVDILAPAPSSAYQLSTGTSIATAHVSGVVALMLERDPSLTPRDVRLILESTAYDLGPRGRDAQFGWGLVNPARAIAMVEQRKRAKGTSQAPSAPSPAPRPVQR